MRRLAARLAVTFAIVGGAVGLTAGASSANELQPQDCYGNPFCIVNCALNPSACPPPFTCTYVWCNVKV